MKTKSNISIRVLSFVMVLMFIGFHLAVTVEAATGLNMSGTTIRGYTYSNSNFTVYNSTGSGKRKIGTCYGSSDLITIRGVGTDGWSRISYPAGRTTKTGYCQTSYLFQNPNFDGATGRVQSNITTYKKADCRSTYGTSTTGDMVFIVGKSNGNTQILYPCNGYAYYKVAWVKGDYTISGGQFRKAGTANNPQGCLDSVASNEAGKLSLTGWAFDRDNLNAKLQILVSVGGPAGSGAAQYYLTANTYRSDVNRAYPGTGNYHGFSSTIKVSQQGNKTVYVYAVNVGGGKNVLLGSKNVNIKSNSNAGSGSSITQGKYVITTALNHSKALDVYNNASNNGANIQIFEASNNNQAQIFSIESAGNKWYKIVHSASRKVLDVCGGKAASGVNVQLYQNNGSAAQLWQFISAGGGYYYIQNKLGYRLDVHGGCSANGTNVWVYSANNSNAQKWKLTSANTQNTPSKARQDVVNYLKQCASIRWTPRKSFLHWSGGRYWYAGTYYTGIPYSQSSRNTSLATFKNNLTGDIYVGPAKQKTYLGSDCSSAVSIAYRTVNGSFPITNTTGLYPKASYMKAVGSYRHNNSTDAKSICRLNGKNVMSNAYAQCQIGDLLLQPGHVMMVTGVYKGYVTVTHQTTYNSSLRSTWRIDQKWTYASLYDGNCIPVTMNAW